MRIAFIADPLDKQYGGIHVFTKEILYALTTFDKKNEYLIVRSESKNEFPNAEEIVVPYKSFPGYRLWRLFYQIPRILSKKKVDIVVEPAHFGPFNLPGDIKRITVIHDMTVFLYPKHHVFFSQYFQRLLLPGILKNSDHIITNSENTTMDVIHFFPKMQHKISSIHLGKSDQFKPTSNPSIFKKYDIKEPYILFVGTLEPRKNVSILIRAYNQLKAESGLPHKLVLIGKKGWKSQRIFQAIENSSYRDDIIMLGYVDKSELPDFYSSADVFVYPSIYEGFGLPVLEAMSCGVPVITSNVSSLPELGGAAVKYADPKDASEIAHHIITLCSNPEIKNKYSRLGLEQAKKFNWEKTARKYIDTFESLMKI